MTTTNYVLFGYKLESKVEGRVWTRRIGAEGDIECDILLVRESEKDWRTSFLLGGHVVIAGFGRTPQEAIRDIEPSTKLVETAMNILYESMEQYTTTGVTQ